MRSPPSPGSDAHNCTPVRRESRRESVYLFFGNLLNRTSTAVGHSASTSKSNGSSRPTSERARSLATERRTLNRRRLSADRSCAPNLMSTFVPARRESARSPCCCLLQPRRAAFARGSPASLCFHRHQQASALRRGSCFRLRRRAQEAPE